jgi:hypothetical protein
MERGSLIMLLIERRPWCSLYIASRETFNKFSDGNDAEVEYYDSLIFPFLQYHSYSPDSDHEQAKLVHKVVTVILPLLIC